MLRIRQDDERRDAQPRRGKRRSRERAAHRRDGGVGHQGDN